MKKVGVITRHAVANYGSLLQSHATEQVIRNLGYEAEIINYIPRYEQSYRLALNGYKISKESRSIRNRAEYIIGQSANFMNSYYFFKRLRKKYLHESLLYSNKNELNLCVKNYDIFCTGSDQVWNEISAGQIDENYFLGFVNGRKPCFSYAASFGKSTVDDHNVSVVKSLLKKYDSISVREKSGINILEEFNLKGTEVIDPTLLLDRHYWKKLTKTVINDEYILVYQLKGHKGFDEFVKKVAETKKIKVFRVTTVLQQIPMFGKTEYLPNIDRLLALFLNAKCIITDSFHATAFSINLNRNFVTFLPGINNNRVHDFLELVGLEERLLTDYTDLTFYEKDVDFTKANKVLDKKRIESMEYLERTLLELSGL